MTAKTLSEIAHLCGAVLEGDGERRVLGPASLSEASDSEISFLANPKYRPQLETTRAAAVLVAGDVTSGRTDLALLRCADPNRAFSLVVRAFAEADVDLPEGVHASVVTGRDCEVAPDVRMGAGVVLGDGVRIGAGSVLHPGVVVGSGCEIGTGCVLYPNVTLYPRVRVGARCVIHAGAVVGAEGFGFEPTPEGWVKIPQCGTVVLEDDVEIGANCTIDRARFGATHVRRGAKLDNLVHVAHNCEIGENVLLAAQVGVSGSSEIADWAMLGGQAGVAGHVKVGARARLAGRSAVFGDVPPDVDYLGFPARPRREALKRLAAAGRVPRMLERLEELERRLAELEGDRA